ncbi:PAS domain S-box protein [Oxynema aestuarii]|uniref:PAS domain S-box protein n=1 Tax=Oxynema aestuarii AP17 TaxID=2064643 RepID=A0A6H1TSU3_9CYAN|nr:PAS domain S-box protein [Oxynema aestuarii]QIZ69678.1 PAS domain S-box protein [Oxynema aestuarii AP17]
MGLVGHQRDRASTNRNLEKQSSKYTQKTTESSLQTRARPLPWLELPDPREKMFEGQSIYQQIGRDLPIAMALVRPSDGVIVYANPRLEKLFGYEDGQLVGCQTLQLYWNPNQRAELVQSVSERGEISDWPLLAKKIDGSPIWVSMNARQQPIADEALFLKTFIDITHFKQAKDTLKVLLDSPLGDGGTTCLGELARYLALAVGARSAFVAELVGGNDRPARIWVGNPQQPIQIQCSGCECLPQGEYWLNQTPWAQVLDLGQGSGWLPPEVVCFTDAFDSDGEPPCQYFGVRLEGRDGRALGLVGLIGDRHWSADEETDSILRCFAARATAELERRQLEEALQLERRKQQLTVEGGSILTYTLDLRGRPLQIEGSAPGILGGERVASAEENRAEIEAELAFDRYRQRPEISRAIARGLAGRAETWVESADGSLYRHETHPLYNTFGDPIGLFGKVRELPPTAAIYQGSRDPIAPQTESDLFVGGPVTVFQWQPRENWPVASVSPNVTQFGYHPQTFIEEGLCYAEIVHPDDLPRVAAEVEQFLAAGQDRFEQNYRICCANGESRWIRDFTVVVRDRHGEILHYRGYIVDITVSEATPKAFRQQALFALQESETRLRQALQAARMGVWDWERHSNRVTWSLGVEGMFGLPPGCFGDRPESYWQYVHPDDRATVRKAVMRAVSAKTNYYNEHRLLDPASGRVRWIAFQGDVVCDEAGAVLRMTGTVVDISDRKQTEAALTQSEAHFRAILNSSLQAVVFIDCDYRIQVFNKTARLATEAVWQKTIQPGDSIYEYVAPEDLEDFNRDFHAALAGHCISTQRNIRGNGTEDNWFEVSYYPVFDENDRVIGVCFIALDITERKAAVDALYRSEERFRSLVQYSSDTIAILTDRGAIAYTSPSSEKILGYTPEQLIGKNVFEYIHPDDRHSFQELFLTALARPDFLVEIECRFLHGNGEWIYLESVGSNRLDDPSIRGFVVNARDVTDRHQQEEWLKLLERAIAASNNGIVITDACAGDNPVVYVNRAFEEITGYRSAEVLGKNCRFLQGKNRDTTVLNRLRSAIRNGEDCTVILQNYRKDSTPFWNELRLSPVKNDRGRLTHFIGVQIDITERKNAEEKLIHQAYYDALTGLPNRALFMEQLHAASQRVKDRSDRLFAVLFIDLDRFKIVNDSLGHAIGDMLLVAIAYRLQKGLAELEGISSLAEAIDPPPPVAESLYNYRQSSSRRRSANFTVARLGGDHFTILLDNLHSLEEATVVAESIHAQLSAPFTFSGHEVFVTASIGIALSTTDYDAPADLLRNADLAMYAAKAAGKARYAVFDKAMHDRAVQRLQLENDLRRTLHDLETEGKTDLFLTYQPIVSLIDGHLVGFETLVRWQHPQKGLISPAQFIPLAEENGTIVPLGEWVLYEACQQLVRWQRDYPHACEHLSLSVNLSGKQFLQPDLVENIDRTLRETGLNPEALKLEITESVLMRDTEAATKTLLELKKRRIHLCLDDFGTGYSSLSHLAQFPIDTLKIDRSFVSRMISEGKDLEIVQAIVSLAHALDMNTIAEGIETAGQLVQLKSLGCQQGQGYWFSKPVDTDRATQLIRSSNRP